MLLMALLLLLLLLLPPCLSQCCTGLTCARANADSGQLPCMEHPPSAAAAWACSSAASPASAVRSSAVADAVHVAVTQVLLEAAADAATGSCTASAVETDAPPSTLHWASPFASTMAQAGRNAEQPWQTANAQQPPNSSCGVSSSEHDCANTLGAGGLEVSRQADLQAGPRSIIVCIHAYDAAMTSSPKGMIAVSTQSSLLLIKATVMQVRYSACDSASHFKRKGQIFCTVQLLASFTQCGTTLNAALWPCPCASGSVSVGNVTHVTAHVSTCE